MFASNLSRQSNPLHFFHALVAWFAPVLWKFPVGDCAGLTCFGNFTSMKGCRPAARSHFMSHEALWPQVRSFGSDDSIAELLDVAAGRRDPWPRAPQSKLNSSFFQRWCRKRFAAKQHWIRGVWGGRLTCSKGLEDGERDFRCHHVRNYLRSRYIARGLKPGVWRWLLRSPLTTIPFHKTSSQPSCNDPTWSFGGKWGHLWLKPVIGCVHAGKPK